MIQTRFTALLGCTAPIQLAGMGNARRELAAAVARAGALGMLGGVMQPAATLASELEDACRDGGGPIGVNFLMPFLDREAVEAVAERARVVEFFYGEPEAGLVGKAHTGGALAAWQIGSAHEAKAAEAAGCDFLVAQGVEAGGHVRGTTALLPLLDEVLDAVGVPVVAAGGIGTGRGMAAALAAGADGVRVGTRFLAAEEADVHASYLEALIDAGPDDTVLTEAFSVMWPNAPHRVLRSCVAAAEALDDEFVAEIEHAGTASRFRGSRRRRRAAGRPAGSTRWLSTPVSPWARSGSASRPRRSCASSSTAPSGSFHARLVPLRLGPPWPGSRSGSRSVACPCRAPSSRRRAWS